MGFTITNTSDEKPNLEDRFSTDEAGIGCQIIGGGAGKTGIYLPQRAEEAGGIRSIVFHFIIRAAIGWRGRGFRPQVFGPSRPLWQKCE